MKILTRQNILVLLAALAGAILIAWSLGVFY